LWIVNRLKPDRQKNQGKGFDSVKNVNGRKRHIGVDTLGLIWAIVVTAANIQDRDGLKLLCLKMKGLLPRLYAILADAGYQGLHNFTFLHYRWLLQIIRRRDTKPGFNVLPKRWIVERTFAWLGIQRRLAKDYEVSTHMSEAFIMLTNIRICLKRIH
jgi:transposase